MGQCIQEWTGRPCHLKFLKGCLLQFLIGSFLNTLLQIV